MRKSDYGHWADFSRFSADLDVGMGRAGSSSKSDLSGTVESIALAPASTSASTGTVVPLSAATVVPGYSPSDSNLPTNNTQPSIGIVTVIQLEGLSPAGPTTGAYMGQIHHFAGTYVPGGSMLADGQLLPVAQNASLWGILKAYYGGNGTSTFALPDLAGGLMVGAGAGVGLTNRALGDQFGSDFLILQQAEMPTQVGGAGQGFDNVQVSAAINYVITVNGFFPHDGGSLHTPSEMMGAVWQFAGDVPPPNTMFAHGQLLQISENDALFTLIGNQFGGDGEQTFALPDLRGRTIVGANGTMAVGTTFGSELAVIGTSNLPASMGYAGTGIDSRQPGIALNYIIALQGVFPSSSGGNTFSNDAPILGEIVAFAGTFAPGGWAFANGQTMTINQNQPLFSIMGSTYGGNGQTTFLLPDLRGRTIQGADFSAVYPGQWSGVAAETLLPNEIPGLNFSGTENGETLSGGGSFDIINGLGGNDTLNGNGDILIGGLGNDVLNGGLAAYSTATTGVTVDLAIAIQQNTIGAGLDTLTNIYGIIGSDFVDTLSGNETANRLDGLAGGDFLYGRGGDDEIIGGLGNDHLEGAAGFDRLDGGDGDDTLLGGADEDTLKGGAGNDILDGGIGSNDTADYSGATAGVTVNLLTTVAQDTIGAGVDTLTGIERIIGSSFDDTLTGNALANTISGGSGNDTLYGGDGVDTLDGGAGNDTLDGGAGTGTLSGDAGNDIYIVNSAGVSITEYDSQGTDEVRTTLSTYGGIAYVEIIRFLGTGNFSANGAGLAETFYGGSGNDTVNGFAGADTLYFNAGGDDIGSGGTENDTFYYGAALTAADQNDGGTGTDMLVLQGDYNLTFGALSLVGFESVSLVNGGVTSWGDSGTNFYDYSLTMLDANVAAGRQLVVNGKALRAGEDFTFNGSAETDGTFLVYAGQGVDNLTGGAGNDGFYFGGSIGASDVVNGGGGSDDQVALQGDYSGGLILNAANFPGVETFALLPGNVTAFGEPGTNFYDYNVTTLGSFGRNIIINSNQLRVGEDLTFNGSAETTGSFTFFGGFGTENLTGGAQSDGFYFGPNSRFSAGDMINGGGGSDNQLGLHGDYSINFNAAGFTNALTNIQTIALISDSNSGIFSQVGDGEFDYSIVLSNGQVAAGQQLTVTGTRLTSAEVMVVDGSAETDGTLRLLGGASADTLTGGAGADIIFGGLGADLLRGNGGADRFLYSDVAQSTAGTRDWIVDFEHLTDKLDIAAIDANALLAGNQAFDFIGAAAFSASGASSAGQLRAYQSDAAANIWQVAGDTNGDGTADFVVQVTVLASQSMTSGDFLL